MAVPKKKKLSTKMTLYKILAQKTTAKWIHFYWEWHENASEHEENYTTDKSQMQNKQFLSPLFTFLVSMFSSILSAELFKMNKYQLQSHKILKKTKNKARTPAFETTLARLLMESTFPRKRKNPIHMQPKRP